MIARGDFADRQRHDAAIDASLKALSAEIVALAGYMRVLTTPFVEKWQGRLINIHPALLPAFKGLDTHRRALEAGARIHGCTAHFVTPEVDDGPIIAQGAVPVLAGDSVETLAARVLKAEHQVYPLALRLVAEGRARMENGRTVFDLAGASERVNSALVAPDLRPWRKIWRIWRGLRRKRAAARAAVLLPALPRPPQQYLPLRALRVIAAARSNSGLASAGRPSLTRRSPRTLGSR